MKFYISFVIAIFTFFNENIMSKKVVNVKSKLRTNNLNGQIREFVKTLPIPFIMPVKKININANAKRERYHVISSKPLVPMFHPNINRDNMDIKAILSPNQNLGVINHNRNIKNYYDNKDYHYSSNNDHKKNNYGFESFNSNSTDLINKNVNNNTNNNNTTEVVEIENCVEYNKISNVCTRCEKGFYLNHINGKYICVDTCNHNQIANNLLMTCFIKDSNNIRNKTSFSYMFTISRCENNCMNEFEDCSCKDECVSRGNCCDDFIDFFLEYSIFLNNQNSTNINSINSQNRITLKCKNSKNYLSSINRKTNSRIINNCEHEYKNKSNDFKCSKCMASTKMFEEECIKNCPNGYFNDNFVNVCKKRYSDDIFNSNYTELSLSLCNKTHPFILNYKDQKHCLHTCPVGYRANKMSLTCEKSDFFSFHWVFPSKGSCNNHCGNHKNLDCSCHFSCLKEGKCCDDYEKECTENILYDNCPKLCDDCSKNGNCLNCKNNSRLHTSNNNSTNTCECIEGYEYDLIGDICTKKSDSDHEFTSDIQNTKKFVKDEKTFENSEIIFKNSTSNSTLNETEKKNSSETLSNTNSTKMESNSTNFANNTNINTTNELYNSTLVNITKFNNLNETKIVIEEAEKIDVKPKKHSKTSTGTSSNLSSSKSTQETSSLEFRNKNSIKNK